MCPGNSPLDFVPSGLEIEPMRSTMLVGLAATFSAIKAISESHVQPVNVSFVSARGLGLLSMTSGVDSVTVTGNNTGEVVLSVTSRDAEILNTALRCMKYESTVDVADAWETIGVNFLGSGLEIHIRIRRKPLPYLYKTSSVTPPIHERVTIVTQTFERYEQVNMFIDNVCKFYPSITIIIADDSVNSQTIDKTNVLQYRMPAQTGLFAGRNLGVSQVMTEYFLWADDDYVFTEKTRLELFVEKLDKVDKSWV